jgi:hypothetical protein
MEWSRITGIPLNKLRYEVQRGRLEVQRLGFNILITRQALIEWIVDYGSKYGYRLNEIMPELLTDVNS